MDVQIAAHALAGNLILLTHNTKYFERVKEIEIPKTDQHPCPRAVLLAAGMDREAAALHLRERGADRRVESTRRG